MVVRRHCTVNIESCLDKCGGVVPEFPVNINRVIVLRNHVWMIGRKSPVRC